MSFDPRTLAYPLEALRRRESWRLDALQADLAKASQLLELAKQEQVSLQTEHRDVATAAVPAASAVIDPVVAATRLAYLRSVLVRQADVDRKIDERLGERAQIQARHEQQRTRVESVERHRAGFMREETAEGERVARAEADRDWIARLPWQRRPAGDDPP